jgi:hypothetical protein
VRKERLTVAIAAFRETFDRGMDAAKGIEAAIAAIDRFDVTVRPDFSIVILIARASAVTLAWENDEMSKSHPGTVLFHAMTKLRSALDELSRF